MVEKKQPLLIEHISAKHLEAVTQNQEHLQALRAINPTSLMALPLLIHGQLFGVIAFISSTPSRTYRPRDLRFAEALAGWAALAIQNARLYRASVRATQLRDHVLGVVAHDLRNPLNAILLQAKALTRRGPERRPRNRPEELFRQQASLRGETIQREEAALPRRELLPLPNGMFEAWLELHCARTVGRLTG